MSATSRFMQPVSLMQPPGMREGEWVSAVLRRAAGTDPGRLGFVSMLATADLWRIWRGTRHQATERDRRTHQATGLELTDRGLLDAAGQPRDQAT